MSESFDGKNSIYNQLNDIIICILCCLLSPKIFPEQKKLKNIKKSNKNCISSSDILVFCLIYYFKKKKIQVLLSFLK